MLPKIALLFHMLVLYFRLEHGFTNMVEPAFLPWGVWMGDKSRLFGLGFRPIAVLPL